MNEVSFDEKFLICELYRAHKFNGWLFSSMRNGATGPLQITHGDAMRSEPKGSLKRLTLCRRLCGRLFTTDHGLYR